MEVWPLGQIFEKKYNNLKKYLLKYDTFENYF